MRTLNESSLYTPEPEATKLLAVGSGPTWLGSGNAASNFCATGDSRPTGIRLPVKCVRPTPPGPPVAGSKTAPCAPGTSHPAEPQYWCKSQFPTAAKQVVCTRAVGTDVRMELPVFRRVPW